MLTVARLATALLLVLTIMAGVLFIQHEADRAAVRNALSAPSPDTTVICPTDPASPRYNPETAGRHVSAMSEC